MKTIVTTESGEEVDVMTKAELLEVLPKVLPPTWHKVPDVPSMAQAQWYQTLDGLRICASAAKERDGRKWLHVSVSHRNRMPKWEELKLVKDIVIGENRTAMQVLPPKEKYVNMHPYVLHLWTCLDGDTIPDFTYGGQI